MANMFAQQDCYTITKAFERAANYSTSEQSVYAVMTPMINNMRAYSANFTDRAEAGDLIFNTSASTKAIDATRDELKKLGKDYGWSKDCFPCFEMPEFPDMAFDTFWKDFLKQIMDEIDAMKKMLQQFLDMFDFFGRQNNKDELCAFLDAFGWGTCGPDLRKLLSIIMLMLSNIAFELSSLFDILMAIVAPLAMPALSGFMDTIRKYAMLIVEPLQCMVKYLLLYMKKFDLGDMAAIAVEQIANTSINIGPKADQNYVDRDEFRPVYNQANVVVDDARDLTGDVASFFVEDGNSIISKDYKVPEWNPNAPQTDWGSDYKVGESLFSGETADASKELDDTYEKRKSVDMDNPEEKKAYVAELNKARKARDEAIAKQAKETAAKLRKPMADAKNRIKQVEATILGFIAKIIKLINDAIKLVETTIASLIDEFKKLLSSMLGAGDNGMLMLNKKLELIKLAQMIGALLRSNWGKVDCDEKEKKTPPTASELALGTLSPGSVAFVSPDGAVKLISDPTNSINQVLASKGLLVENDLDPSQKINSLVEFTGDPLIDLQIQDVVSVAGRINEATFECPAKDSVAKSVLINSWAEGIVG